MELYSFISIFALCFSVSIWFIVVLARGRDKKAALRFVPLAVVLVIRFAPLLFGLEWRYSLRGPLDVVVAVFLLIWGIYGATWFFQALKAKKPKVWLYVDVCVIIASLLLSCLLIINQLDFHGIKDTVLKQNGQPMYVRENLDPGSMSMIRYYPYVNGVFRGRDANLDLPFQIMEGKIEFDSGETW